MRSKINEVTEDEQSIAAKEVEDTVTPEMVEAGVSVLWELEGEASKEVLARAVFVAMASVVAPGSKS